MDTADLFDHPRPDMHRGTREGSDWIDLCGTWDFSFDPDDAGRSRGWFQPGHAFDRIITVPFPCESLAAWGMEEAAGPDNYASDNVFVDPATVTPETRDTAPRHTIGWYHRKLQIPDEWRQKRTILHIGAADWGVEVYLNGQKVGADESGYIPLEFDLTDSLSTGDNDLCIRVEDPQGDQQRPLGKQHNWYTTTSGIWQPVWMEPRPKAHIRNARFTSSTADDTVRCEISCAGADPGSKVDLEIRDSEGAVAATAETEVADDGASLTIELGDDARTWTPDDPHLYTVRIRLSAEDETDVIHSYFGHREVGTTKMSGTDATSITLNGEPVYLKGALDQSLTPEGVYAYLSDDQIRRRLQEAKRAGFNMLRVHIKLEDPRYLAWADRLGILLQCDLPNFGYEGYSDIARGRWERTLRAAIDRDYNHPSIFSWCLFNETWGLGGHDYKEQTDRQGWVRQMYELARSLDPTRLVEDNSPCLADHVVTDINSWHFYINDYQEAAEHIEEVVQQAHPGSGFNFVPSRTQDEQPLMNSEYGGISARMGDKDVSWCFKFLTDLLRRHPRICGYVYTELTDIEWERNGIYDYDLGHKEFGYELPALQSDPYFAFEGPPGETVEPAGRCSLPVFCVSAGQIPDVDVQIHATDTLGLPMDEWPEGTLEWNDTGARVAEGTWECPQPLPSEPCLMKLEAFREGKMVDFKYLEIRDGELPKTECMDDGSVLLRTVAGGQEHSSGWHEAEMERGLVGYQIHLLGGIESGHFDYRFELPEGRSLEDFSEIELVAELSSRRPEASQTGEEGWPSDLVTSMNGVEVDRRTLENQYADSRGALSHMHGFWGRYGDLVRLRVDGPTVPRIARCDDTGVEVRFAVPRDGHAGGLIVYSSRAGRFPVDLTLLLRP